MHTFKDPKEYFRATMAHPYAEQPLFDWEDRILGWLSVPRGAYPLRSRHIESLIGRMTSHWGLLVEATFLLPITSVQIPSGHRRVPILDVYPEDLDTALRHIGALCALHRHRTCMGLAQ